MGEDTCKICGGEMTEGVFYRGRKGRHTWMLCPHSHEGIPLEVRIEDIEDRGTCILVERGGLRSLIVTNVSSKASAERIRNELESQGFAQNEKKSKGVLTIPAPLARDNPTFRENFDRQRREREQNTTKQTSTQIPKVKKTKKRVATVAKKKLSDEEITSVGADVVSMRDNERLSWKVIADRTGLGSPGRARKVYTDTSGRPHNEAPGVVRQNSHKRETPEMLDQMDPFFEEDVREEEILEVITPGKTVRVKRNYGIDEYRVKKIEGIGASKKGVRYLKFIDADEMSRTPGIASIIGVR